MRASAHRIVVGVDGSPGAALAVDWASTEARLRACTLVLAHVAPPDFIALTAGASAVAPPATAHRPDYVDDAVARLQTEDLELEVECADLVGPPAAALLNLTGEAAMVVVGARGRSRVAEVLLGSVSRHVGTHARCPAVIVRGAAPKATWPVAVGVDGSPGSAVALRVAALEAQLRGVTLLVVHAWRDMSSTGYGAWSAPATLTHELEAEAEDLADRMVDEIAEEFPDLAVLMRVAQTHPVTAMLAASQESQLLVVGAHGRGAFPGMGIGSVTMGSLHSAASPVMVVPAPHA